MNKPIIFGLLVLILLVGSVNAVVYKNGNRVEEPVVVEYSSGGGGGVISFTPEEFYEKSDKFTRCLIDNCDYFCGMWGFDEGTYFREDKCWCEKYIKTPYGKVVADDGWIEIKECSEPEPLNITIIALIITIFLIFLIYIIYKLNERNKIIITKSKILEKKEV